MHLVAGCAGPADSHRYVGGRRRYSKGRSAHQQRQMEGHRHALPTGLQDCGWCSEAVMLRAGGLGSSPYWSGGQRQSHTAPFVVAPSPASRYILVRAASVPPAAASLAVCFARPCRRMCALDRMGPSNRGRETGAECLHPRLSTEWCSMGIVIKYNIEPSGRVTGLEQRGFGTVDAVDSR